MDEKQVNGMAAAATLHCLVGCAIGEIIGLILGTALGWHGAVTIIISIGLAFLFGYTLSVLPLIGQLPIRRALAIVLVADTLSITTMELTDNVVMAAIPGAMNAGLVNPLFWASMSIAMLAAFFAAFPVNRWLLQRGKGHALTHAYHEGHGHHHGGR